MAHSKISLAAKLAIAVFVIVLVPVYLQAYGPTNFLWFCDAALLITALGMWLENSLLISMCAVGILVPQAVWVADFCSQLFGVRLLGLTGYMFDAHLSLFTRSLSLFHGWLPFLLLWLLSRAGYDKRALPAWSALAAALVLACYFFTPPAGPHPADSNLPIDINYVYGFNDQKPQAWVNQNVYVVILLATLFVVAYLPTHLILHRVFGPPKTSSQSVNNPPVSG